MRGLLRFEGRKALCRAGRSRLKRLGYMRSPGSPSLSRCLMTLRMRSGHRRRHCQPRDAVENRWERRSRHRDLGQLKRQVLRVPDYLGSLRVGRPVTLLIPKRVTPQGLDIAVPPRLAALEAIRFRPPSVSSGQEQEHEAGAGMPASELAWERDRLDPWSFTFAAKAGQRGRGIPRA